MTQKKTESKDFTPSTILFSPTRTLYSADNGGAVRNEEGCTQYLLGSSYRDTLHANTWWTNTLEVHDPPSSPPSQLPMSSSSSFASTDPLRIGGFSCQLALLSTSLWSGPQRGLVKRQSMFSFNRGGRGRRNNLHWMTWRVVGGEQLIDTILYGVSTCMYIARIHKAGRVNKAL